MPEKLVSMSSILSERQTQIIRLQFNEGYTQPEVAKLLGVSLSTVKKDYRAALDLLATLKPTPVIDL